MLSEQRYAKILGLLEEKKSITVAEVTELLGISESTARRDITALDRAGRLTKVFGGAVTSSGSFVTQEPTVAQKVEVHKAEKIQIARRAATMVEDTDFVYLDAGTTTGYMIEFLGRTNGVTKKEGFTTPDAGEAQVKRTAMRQCRKCYVLADSAKFGYVSAVTFASFESGVILTEKIVEGYQEGDRLIRCE